MQCTNNCLKLDQMTRKLDQAKFTIFSWSRSRPKKNYQNFLVDKEIRTRPSKTSSSDNISYFSFQDHTRVRPQTDLFPFHGITTFFDKNTASTR